MNDAAQPRRRPTPRRRAFLLLFVAPAGLAQPAPAGRPSAKDDPCAAAAQLYVAPMGQPWRAPAGQPYPSSAWFAAADADHDGRLTLTEFGADADAFFRRLDSDHDGELAPDEIAAYENAVAPEIQLYQRASRRWIEDRMSKAERKAENAYGGAMGAGRWAQLNIPEPVVAADLDVNGGVSAQEFRRVAAQRFALLRPGKDGALHLADLAPTPAQQQAAACDAQAAKRRR